MNNHDTIRLAENIARNPMRHLVIEDDRLHDTGEGTVTFAVGADSRAVFRYSDLTWRFDLIELVVFDVPVPIAESNPFFWPYQDQDEDGLAAWINQEIAENV